MRTISSDEIGYFEALISRYGSGVYPEFLKSDGATPSNCHENAEAFSRRFPDHVVVRGWLIAELGLAPGYFRLVAHSVNRRLSGELVDVTPLADADRKAYRFIEHVGTEALFCGLRTKFPDANFPFIMPPAFGGSLLVGGDISTLDWPNSHCGDVAGSPSTDLKPG